MLGLGKKFAVLESKFNIYEDLSKEMLDKLERAVATISENSNRIAIILERHENKIHETDKSFSLLKEMIESLDQKNISEHKKVESNILKLENRIEDLFRFRWQLGGVLVVSGLIFGALVSGFISGLSDDVTSLTKPAPSVRIQEKIK